MPSTDLQADLRGVLERAPEDVVCAYLFGSAARGQLGPGSDLDVAILLRHPPGATLAGQRLGLAGEIEQATSRRVDLVILNQAPPDLVHRVLRDGRLVLERDKAARMRFEVRARNEFFDLQPLLRRYRATVLAKVRGGAGP